MIKVNLHGHLKDSFGTGHEFAVHTMADVLRALNANFDNFDSELAKNERRYHVIVDDKVDYGTEDMIPAPIGSNATVDIIPYIEGSGGDVDIWQIIGGIALIAAGIVLTVASEGAGSPIGATLIGMGIGLLVGGIASFFVPDVETEGYSKTNKNTSFSGPKNLVGQGYPVPIGYGRLRIGSNLISATFSNSYEVISTARVWQDDNDNYYVKYSVDIDDPFEPYDLSRLWESDDPNGVSDGEYIEIPGMGPMPVPSNFTYQAWSAYEEKTGIWIPLWGVLEPPEGLLTISIPDPDNPTETIVVMYVTPGVSHPILGVEPGTYVLFEEWDKVYGPIPPLGFAV